MIISNDPNDLITTFKQGGVFAYPTEAIYGFGCDPDNQQAVVKLLDIKKRPIEKGLILVAADFSQVQKYLKPITPDLQKYTIPSATTYIFPALVSAPKWLTGEFDTLAIRISKHPVVKALCETLNSPLVSTSANLSGNEPAKTSEDVVKTFATIIDAVLEGEVGGADKPSTIVDATSGKVLRS